MQKRTGKLTGHDLLQRLCSEGYCEIEQREFGIFSGMKSNKIRKLGKDISNKINNWRANQIEKSIENLEIKNSKGSSENNFPRSFVSLLLFVPIFHRTLIVKTITAPAIAVIRLLINFCYYFQFLFMMLSYFSIINKAFKSYYMKLLTVHFFVIIIFLYSI